MTERRLGAIVDTVACHALAHVDEREKDAEQARPRVVAQSGSAGSELGQDHGPRREEFVDFNSPAAVEGAEKCLTANFAALCVKLAEKVEQAELFLFEFPRNGATAKWVLASRIHGYNVVHT